MGNCDDRKVGRRRRAGAKKGPKNSYEYLNDDDDAMEFSSVLSCGMPLLPSPHSMRSPFPEI